MFFLLFFELYLKFSKIFKIKIKISFSNFSKLLMQENFKETLYIKNLKYKIYKDKIFYKEGMYEKFQTVLRNFFI